MLKDWLGHINNHFHIWNVSYGCHLPFLSAQFFLCSMYVLAAMSNLQNIVELGHSEQFSFLGPSLQSKVILGICRIQCRIATSQDPVIISGKLSYNYCVTQGLVCGFWLPSADTVSPNGSTCNYSKVMWYDTEYVEWHIGEIRIVCVCFLLSLLPVGEIRDPQWHANFSRVGVVIIEIWMNSLWVLW
jgi:hypothetical protein